jgi:hypothetical protein
MDETPLERWRSEEAAKKEAFRLSHPNHRLITRGPRKGQTVRLTQSERVNRRRQERLEEERRKTELSILVQDGVDAEKAKKSLGTKLWAWGVNSEKHPTYALGLFPWLLMMFIAVPIFGILYKLSFTWVGPLMIVAGILISKLRKGRSR